MINLDQSPKLNIVLVFGALIYGWMRNLVLLDIKTFTWEFLIKASSGVLLACVTAFCVQFTNSFYKKKIESKIFKSKHNARRKNEAA